MAQIAETTAQRERTAEGVPLLDVRGLSKSFGGLAAVSDLDLRINQGEIISIIGPNGAGKTTVFNLITGLYQPNGILEGAPHRFRATLQLVGRRLSAILRLRPAAFVRWLLGMLLGVALGILLILFILNVIIYAALDPQLRDAYQHNILLVLIIAWAVYWPVHTFNTMFVGPANGFWANLDAEDSGLSGFRGAIRLQGQTLLGVTPDVVLVRGIARTYQNIRLFNNMTVLENVMVGMHSRLKAGPLGIVFQTKGVRDEEAAAREKAIELLSFFGPELVARKDETVANLAYAWKRRVEICRALAAEPKLLLLDEPTAGMNDAETNDAVAYIRRLRDEKGLTILLIEHKLAVTMGMSDRIAVLDYGRKIAEGTPDEVRNNERVIEAYLGRKSTVA